MGRILNISSFLDEKSDFNVTRRIAAVRRTIVFFFLIGVFLSFKLWVSDRLFPLVSVFDTIPALIYPFDYILIFLLIILMGINLFHWRNTLNVIILLILLFLFIQDQNRWQPWVYVYFIFLSLFSLSRKPSGNENCLLLCFRLIIMGIYLWSGIHKMNLSFINGTFKHILIDFLGFQNRSFVDDIINIGFFIPLFEIAISVFLFVPKLRNIGVYYATATHIFILLYLSPLGVNDNSIVYPWNVAMIFIVFILFYRTKDKISIFKFQKIDLRAILVTILIYIFPILNFFGLWDNYLSFSLYSDKTNSYYIVIAQSQIDKVDKRLSRYFLPIDNVKGGQIIDVGKWSEMELNVPFYPETRTFKKVAKSFCNFGIAEDQLYFLELSYLEKGKYMRYTCKDI